MEKFIQGEWFKFCCKFQGHHEEISKLFAHNFDGFQTQVGYVLIHVKSQAIELSAMVILTSSKTYDVMCALPYLDEE
jgi:hypothetical protein